MSKHSTQRWPVSALASLALALAGYAQALSLAWPLEGSFRGEPQAWLQCVSLAVLAALVDRSESLKESFAKGWLFSLTWLLGSTWWLYISIHTYGDLPAPLAILAVLLLSAGLALFYAVACAVFHAVSRQGVGIAARATAFGAVWVLAEMARGTLWTGFPWGAVGYAHVAGVMQHFAPWLGVYGLCALAAIIAMLLGAERRGRADASQLKQLTFGAVVTVTLGYLWVTSPSQNIDALNLSSKPLTVTLLQGNIAQDLKFGEGVNMAMRGYRESLMASSTHLVVTPETALPLVPEQMPEPYWSVLQQHFEKTQQTALIGLPLVSRNAQGQLQYSNAAVALGPKSATAEPYTYEKHHLVPFGEFVPPLFQWFVRMMNIPLGDFVRGEVAQPTLNVQGERIAPNICYEDLFGEELARSFADPDKAPTMMVNLSNIAWFGNTVALDQHLHISRMRALELGRPMLRATNTGATAIIDAQGHVTHRLPYAEKGELKGEVRGVHGAVTPYAAWVSVWGLWPLAIAAFLSLIAVATLAYGSRHGHRRFGP